VHAKHIGIVAVSAEGAALCYRTLCLEGASLLGSHNHPQITMHTYPLAEYMRHVERSWRSWAPAAFVCKARPGDGLLICPDNIFMALDAVREQYQRHGHIADEVADVTATRHFTRQDSRALPVEGRLSLKRPGIASEIPDAADPNESTPSSLMNWSTATLMSGRAGTFRMSFERSATGAAMP
jgi:hypothetical protein